MVSKDRSASTELAVDAGVSPEMLVHLLHHPPSPIQLHEMLEAADWYPETRTVTFGALINIRPRQNNRSMEIQDPGVRMRVERVIRTLFDEGKA